jgi:hypothetical protein
MTFSRQIEPVFVRMMARSRRSASVVAGPPPSVDAAPRPLILEARFSRVDIRCDRFS